jgi:hypothetical protein
MAAGTVQLADVIVPEIFTPYVQQYTQEKSRLIRSGLVSSSPFLNQFLAGAGLTTHVPSFKDLDNDPENISTDQPATSSPNKIGTAQEIAVRLSRNNSWASYNLVEALIAKDPMAAIGDRVGDYWVRRAQALFIATMKGVFADNDAAPTAGEHVQGDLTFSLAAANSGNYSATLTAFSASAFIDATLTMGDSMESLGTVAVHSIVYGRMQKNNLIEFVPESDSKIMIPKFLGREVIVDDSLPFSGGLFESWLFGAGACAIGMGSPAVPTEVERLAAVGNGGGADVLHNRVEWCMHPTGHAYIGTSPAGGPSNAASANNLAAATSWQRVFTERKQIKIARLVTREM